MTAPEFCPDGRKAVPFYRNKTHEWQRSREARALADRTPIVRGKVCRWVHYAAREWQARASAAREAFYRWRQAMKDPAAAICHVFGPHCEEAKAVARCESGSRDLAPHAVYASNGQYLGMFQMGDYARSRYGHGMTPLEQARAAYLYFVASGRDWSPWQCRPWGLAW